MLSEDGDIIPPAAFLPMAERFGVIGEIDRWVTNAGLRLAIDGEGVAINLSGYSIGDMGDRGRDPLRHRGRRRSRQGDLRRQRGCAP